MAVHWQIKFTSLRMSRLYTVNIYDDNYSGSPIQLTGAEQPFSTTEDESEDWFKPVRYQSGYIRILDTGKDNAGNTFDWKNLIPATAKSRPVTVTHEYGVSTIIDWQGYIQPQTFSGQMYEDTQVRQYPVCCALSVLEGEDPVTTDEGLVNFAYILTSILGATGVNWEKVNFTGEDFLREWATKRVCWNNFIEYDDDNNRIPKYNYMQMLEELCKYFGWMCRTFGDQIYFLSPDDELYPDFTSIGIQDLEELAADYTAPIHYDDYEWRNMNTDQDIYASTNNSIKYLQGICKAEVSADFGLLKKILSIPFEEIKNDLEKGTPPTYVQQGDTYVFSKSDIPDQNLFHDMDVYYEEQQGIWEPSPFSIVQVYEGYLSLLHNYSMTSMLTLSGGQNVESPPDQIIRFMGKYDYCFSGGVIYIKGTFSANAGGKLLCKFSIGAKWFNGTDWVDNETSFYILFGNEADMTQEGDSLPIITTRDRDDPYPRYEGWGIEIPTTEALVGKPTLYMSLVHINDSTAAGEGIYARMKSFEIGFLRRNDIGVDDEKGKNTFKGSTDKVFNNEVSVNTIYAVDDGNNFGNGLLLNENNTYCDGLLYTYSNAGGYEKPEEHLLERIINHGKNVKKKESVEFRTGQVDGLSPTMWLNTVNMSGYPISISREWRDDITKVLIIEP